jgi:hypothetical protein
MAFAGLGVLTMLALLAYDRIFGSDSAATRARARRVMIAVYALLVVAAIAMPCLVASTQGQVAVKTWIQAGIMVAVGAGGLATMLRRRPDRDRA